LGFSYITFRKVLAGEQVPQARTLQLIASYLPDRQRFWGLKARVEFWRPSWPEPNIGLIWTRMPCGGPG
jgi:hypothetical protein